MRIFGVLLIVFLIRNISGSGPIITRKSMKWIHTEAATKGIH